MIPNYEQQLQKMSDAIRAFPWSDARAYGNYIAQTYYYVSHSTRLLALAAGRMDHNDNVFHKRFLDHAAEEKGHELMAKNDLKALGFTLEDFPELPETRMFWESQYYKIQHLDPMALMGYILPLEAIACRECPWITKELKKAYPTKCYTFMKVHGEEDPEHVSKALEAVKALPLHRHKHIIENFHQSVLALCNIISATKAQSLQVAA